MLVLLAILTTSLATDILHGGIGLGYYYLTVRIGSNKQPQTLILDTGSYQTVLACTGCKTCGKHTHAPFDYAASSTFEMQGRPLAQTYAEGSAVKGFFGLDTVFFSAASQSLPVGCVQHEEGSIQTQAADGILGLASFSSAYSFCLGSAGFFTLEPLHVQEAMSLKLLDDDLLATDLTELLFGESATHFDEFSIQRYTILDTGTTFVYLAPYFYRGFVSSLEKYTENTLDMPGETYCVSARQLENIAEYPDIVFKLRDKYITWEAESYFYEYRLGVYCVGIYENQEEYNLLGALFLRHRLVSVTNRVVEFSKLMCNGEWYESPESTSLLLFIILFLMSLVGCVLYVRFKGTPKFLVRLNGLHQLKIH